MVSTKSVSQFLSTVRYLQSRQITGRFLRRLKPLLEKPQKLYSRAIPEFAGCRWHPVQNFLPPGLQNNSASNILTGRFSFLNNEQYIGSPADWNRNSSSKLWLYNLHYFDYLWTLDYDNAKRLVSDWIDNYPLRQKHIGWQPYPTSLRLMNLCAVFFGKYRKQIEQDETFLQKLWSSIYIQTQWLSKNLETHLLGNHLLENGAALAFTGSCFSGDAAKKWFQTGTRILAEQLPEQILADGVHFELSAMYHCRIAYLLAMLLNTGCAKLVDLVKQPLTKMITALKPLAHPDGGIALLNDSAFDIYNPPAQLLSYAGVFFEIDNDDCGNFALAEAGYYGFGDDKGTYIICDAARIGPDYIPGHAHADIFSFELSLNACRVIVDSGVYDYEATPMRQYCRSTKAHNTLEIDGQDQCQMWASFRVARRGRPFDIKWMPGKNGFQLSARHNGYKRLNGNPEHFRQFNWNKTGILKVKDITSAHSPKNITSRLHLHPDCKIDQLKDNTAAITYPKGNFKIIFLGNGKLSIEDSYYCPQFGVKIPNKALAFSFNGCNTETGFQIEAS